MFYVLSACPRNHKALLDEVLRLEELAGDLINRMEQTESDNKVTHCYRYKKLRRICVTDIVL